MREPDRDCPLCPRLQGFRDTNRGLYPDWHNAPVPSFAGEDPWLLIVGIRGWPTGTMGVSATTACA